MPKDRKKKMRSRVFWIRLEKHGGWYGIGIKKRTMDDLCPLLFRRITGLRFKQGEIKRFRLVEAKK